MGFCDWDWDGGIGKGIRDWGEIRDWELGMGLEIGIVDWEFGIGSGFNMVVTLKQPVLVLPSNHQKSKQVLKMNV